LVAVALAIAAPAHATITNVAVLDGAQDPIPGDTVPDYEEIWAYVTSPSGGVVCIHTLVAQPGGCDDAGAYAKTLVPPFYAGFVPVAGGNLHSGAYMLVGAEGLGAPATAQSAEFYVEPCGNCQLTDITKESPFHAASQAMLDSVKTVCGLISTASMLWRSRKVYEFASDALTLGPGGLNAGAVVSFSLAAHEAYAEVENGDSLTAKLPGALGTIADTLCDAAEKIDKVQQTALKAPLGGWVADPPDLNYLQVAAPSFTDYDAILGMRDYGYGTERADMDQIRAYSASSLHGFERYQGAKMDANANGAHLQARAMSDDLLAYAAALRRSARFVTKTAAQIRSEFPAAADRTVTQGDLDLANEVLDRIRTTGYTAGEISRLHAVGMDDIAIARLRVDQSLFDPSDVAPAALDQRFDALAAAMAGLADEAETFGRTAAVNAGRSARPLGAEYTYGLQGEGLLAVHFDDASTNVGKDPVTIHWDFGDGASADGRHVTHRFASKGTYPVSETVSSDFATATASHQIDAGTPNMAPVASFTATPGQGTAPLVVHLDASASSDDGLIAGYEWDFGDGSTNNGDVLDHTFQEPDADGYVVTLKVTDDEGASTTTKKTVMVGKPPLPPDAQDDAMEAPGAGVIDALANDSDPNGDHIAVVSTGTPAHGTAACTALGACSYTAQSGYQGPDAFTYTVHDPGALSATATVTVDVTGPPEPSRPQPEDDTLVVAGGAGSVGVLANDDGKPALVLTGSDDPQHGTVGCDPDGQCTYTPDPGFTGHDGFGYSMSDGTLNTAGAEVHVTVLPPGAAYGVGVTGTPDPLAAGSEASWSIGVSDLAPQAPHVGFALNGSHTLVPGSLHTARGWAPEAAGAQAGAGALLGDTLDVPLTKPSATVSQSVGGDGFVPILVGDRMFAIHHIAIPTAVSCVDRRTNHLCPGYPVPVGVGTTDIPGPAVLVGTRIYGHVVGAINYTQTAPAALFCWDTATVRPCGLAIAARLRRTTNPTGSAPVLAAGKLWFAMDNGRLYCVDPATNAACGSIDTGLDHHNQVFDILAHGSKVFVSQMGGDLACIDVSLAGACLGWTLPRPVAGGGVNLVNRHAADGALNGICLVSGSDAHCWPDSGSGTGTVIDDFPANGGYWDVSQEAEMGTRTLIAEYPYGGVACFDWATQALCTGAGYAAEPPDGRVTKDVYGDPLPTSYGVTSDGSCAIALGDEGLMFTIDPKGYVPCTGVAGDHAVDLRDQRCDGGVGGATWTSVGLRDTADGELGAVRVTVRDAATGAVLATKNLVNGALDLSGIDAAAHPALALGIAMTAHPASAAWDDHIPPRVQLSWHADPLQVCFRTATPAACHADPVGVHAAVGAAAADAQVAVTPQTCPEPPPVQTSPATTPPPPAERPGATDLILQCSTKPVVLEDVYLDRGRVRLLGVADRRLAGQKVEFVLSSTGKVVASAVVGTDGQFAASAPQPPRKLRRSNRTRYLARIGAERSINLKLVRRMIVTAVTVAGGRVTIAGRVVKPLATGARDRRITLQRTTSCTSQQTVKTFAPRANGTFSVTVPVPAGQRAAVYRMRTKVRVSKRSKTLSTTFTLPRAIQFS
jgi:PKD repeat protein